MFNTSITMMNESSKGFIQIPVHVCDWSKDTSYSLLAGNESENYSMLSV